MATPTPIPASVLYLRMRGFGALDTAGQAARRERLVRTLAGLLPLWPEDGRIVVRAADGAAIVGLDSPEVALEAARQAVLESDLDIGLHHGPVRTRSRDAGQLTGDGLETAQAIAGLSPDHPLLATSEFRRALHAAAPHLGKALRTAGKFVDGRDREQRLHAPDNTPPEPPPLVGRRQLLVGGSIVAGILCLGVAARVVRKNYEEARRPAVLRLDIRPGGELWVDGEMKGQIPPLVQFEIPPGAHVVEVRNGRNPPMRLEVQAKAGESIDVRHVFVARSPRKSGWLDRFKFWGNP